MKFVWLLLLLYAVVISSCVTYVFYYLLKRSGFTISNYREIEVVKSLGISLILVMIAILPVGLIVSALAKSMIILLALTAFLGITGFLDDQFGTQGAKGFKGHFKALFKGKITTGFIKAISGLFAGIVLAYYLGGNPMWMIVGALAFALCVNFFNLLDLRPGRSLKVYLIFMIVYLFMATTDTYVVIFILILVTLPLFYLDLREKAMLGDSGSNIIGGYVGLITLIVFPGPYRLAPLTIFLFFNILSEKYSFSALIEKNRMLKQFDNLGRSS